MNILLFLPGFLVLLFQYRGMAGTIEAVVTIAVIQVRPECIIVSALTLDIASPPGSVLPVESSPGKGLLYLGIRFLQTISVRMDGQLALCLGRDLSFSGGCHEPHDRSRKVI